MSQSISQFFFSFFLFSSSGFRFFDLSICRYLDLSNPRYLDLSIPRFQVDSSIFRYFDLSFPRFQVDSSIFRYFDLSIPRFWSLIPQYFDISTCRFLEFPSKNYRRRFILSFSPPRGSWRGALFFYFIIFSAFLITCSTGISALV